MKNLQDMLNEVDDLPEGPNPNRVLAQRGKRHSEETRRKMSKSHTGKKKTEEHRRNIGLAKKGVPLGPLSEEQKEHLRQVNTGYVHDIVACPHCGTQGGETSTKRWHFENCIFRDKKVLQKFESAYKEGPKTSANHKTSWSPTAKKYGIDARRLLAYIETVRPFLRSKP